MRKWKKGRCGAQWMTSHLVVGGKVVRDPLKLRVLR